MEYLSIITESISEQFKTSEKQRAKSLNWLDYAYRKSGYFYIE